MGRNKKLREALAGLEKQIRAHERKIAEVPNATSVGAWQREIETWKTKRKQLVRRLKRNW
jgi:predicted  nucleic acid-binding Zn-ribbon protein